ncbi:MAG: hypothetical protein F4X76_01320 [Chloroflexi bacterium]|nr:hypothetical protein [Chloroflexota bacterium]
MPTQEEVEGGALLLVEAIASAGPRQADPIWHSILGAATEYIDEWEDQAGDASPRHLAMQTYARYLAAMLRDLIDNPGAGQPTITFIEG